MIADLFGWIADVIGSFFNTIITIITTFIEAIFAVIGGILYLLYKIGVLATKLFMLFYELGSILISLVVGITRTLGSIVYNPGTSSGHGYSEVIVKVFDTMTNFDISPVAYILSFLIWFTTGFYAIRIISTFRNL